jgi:hypothetical protein
MPKTHQLSDSMYIYYNSNELPRNVLVYINELKNSGYNVEFKEYTEELDETTGEKFNWLELYILIDAEERAKNNNYSGIRIERNFDTLSQILNLNSVNLKVIFTNKEAFAKKVLIGLKKHLKESYVGDFIHQIRFDTKNNNTMEIKIIRKSFYSWHTQTHMGNRIYDRDIVNVAREYLDNLGYKSLNVYI